MEQMDSNKIVTGSESVTGVRMNDIISAMNARERSYYDTRFKRLCGNNEWRTPIYDHIVRSRIKRCHWRIC